MRQLQENSRHENPARLFRPRRARRGFDHSGRRKGCVKGAVVGGVAGHYAGHHGVLGAIAGCAYGRHRAKEQARQPKGQAPVGQEKI
jgi:hypothetical protein